MAAASADCCRRADQHRRYISGHLSVGDHATEVNLAEDIFSQDISGATYIAYSSDRNVVGFQLNGTSDGTMLDGLPGSPFLSIIISIQTSKNRLFVDTVLVKRKLA